MRFVCCALDHDALHKATPPATAWCRACTRTRICTLMTAVRTLVVRRVCACACVCVIDVARVCVFTSGPKRFPFDAPIRFRTAEVIRVM
jgi:hypothetical protein